MRSHGGIIGIFSANKTTYSNRFDFYVRKLGLWKVTTKKKAEKYEETALKQINWWKLEGWGKREEGEGGQRLVGGRGSGVGGENSSFNRCTRSRRWSVTCVRMASSSPHWEKGGRALRGSLAARPWLGHGSAPSREVCVTEMDRGKSLLRSGRTPRQRRMPVSSFELGFATLWEEQTCWENCNPVSSIILLETKLTAFKKTCRCLW